MVIPGQTDFKGLDCLVLVCQFLVVSWPSFIVAPTLPHPAQSAKAKTGLRSNVYAAFLASKLARRYWLRNACKDLLMELGKRIALLFF